MGENNTNNKGKNLSREDKKFLINLFQAKKQDAENYSDITLITATTTITMILVIIGISVDLFAIRLPITSLKLNIFMGICSFLIGLILIIIYLYYLRYRKEKIASKRYRLLSFKYYKNLFSGYKSFIHKYYKNDGLHEKLLEEFTCNMPEDEENDLHDELINLESKR